MYNEFGTPYIVYDMHQTWIETQIKSEKVRTNRALGRHLTIRFARVLQFMGKSLSNWGESLQYLAQQHMSQPA